jgi:hypothetical protein
MVSESVRAAGAAKTVAEYLGVAPNGHAFSHRLYSIVRHAGKS